MSKRRPAYSKPEKKLKVQENLLTKYYTAKVQHEDKNTLATVKKEEITQTNSCKNTVQVHEIKTKTPQTPEDYIKKPELLETITPYQEAKYYELNSSPNENEEKIYLSDTFYLDFFKQIIEDMSVYKTSMFNDSDNLIINSFLCLSQPSQILYTRLLMRQDKYILQSSLSYPGIANPIFSCTELILKSFAYSSDQAFLLNNIQDSYIFLYSLTIDFLSQIEQHLRNVLIKKLDIDTVDISAPKPWCKLWYLYTKNIYYKNHIEKIGFQVSEEFLDSRKNQKIMAVMEILSFLKGFFIGVEENMFLDMVKPKDFPEFICLENKSRSLFIRIQHAYGFYSSENIMGMLGENSSKGLIKADYVVSAKEFPLFLDYEDTLKSEAAYCFKLLLENLQLYRYSQQTCYVIAKEIALIGLEDFKMNIQDFLFIYKNIQSPDWKLQYTNKERWARTLHICVDIIQKSKDWDLSLVILFYLLSNPYYITKRGHWWERVIIISNSHINLKSESEDLKTLALSDPYLRTGKRLKLETRGQKRLNPHNPYKFFDYLHPLYEERTIKAFSVTLYGKLRFVIGNEDMSVEDYALNHLKSEGWLGFHSENSILPSIYGILMWEFLFYDKIPYVFQNRYQNCPLDFRDDNFMLKRIDVYEKIYTEISQAEDVGEYFDIKYEKYKKQMNLFVDWGSLETWGKPFVKNVIKGLKSCLLKIIQVFAENYRYYSSGMPDLVLIKNEQVKFVEVKSTNDKLSDQQRMWIRLLTINGCCTEVLHIVDITKN
ncbi:hypothetical protein SteCoe_23369 [Stentor coeruleus]|uniref:Fanconi-associated nuclease n=1 Tax=Stentor coeruleus TaxID=5963 RepID=A0A1R2BK12_9CILI|nr:hypothetical protein SteCoe_23369 [Stentor coeruleus]